MIDLTNHFIAWGSEGEIALIAFPDTMRRSDPYQFSWGAGNVSVRESSFKRRKELLQMKVWVLILSYGVPAANVRECLKHLKEFQAIEGDIAESL